MMVDTLQWIAIVGLAAAIVAIGFALLSLRRLVLLLTDENRIAMIARRSVGGGEERRAIERLAAIRDRMAADLRRGAVGGGGDA